MAERKKINKSTIEKLKEEGFSAEEVAEKLEMTITDYKEILKFFGITGRHKTGVKSRFELIDDTTLENTNETNIPTAISSENA